jgi:AcrR family transcriptional regulator
MEPNNTRRNLLDAASRVVARDGVAKLTLDAVARETGMSKGTVLYHFHTKDALIEGMVESMVARADANIAAQVRAHEGDRTPGHWLRAFIRATPMPLAEGDDPSAGLVAAIGINPALMDGARIRYAGWQARVEGDGLDPALATLLRLAADGLWACEVFGLAPPTGELRERVIARMLELATPGGASAPPPGAG